MRNGIIGAFLLLLTLCAGFYLGFRVSDCTYVEVDGEYLTRYEIQAMIDESEESVDA